jgi:hypothetical protein
VVFPLYIFFNNSVFVISNTVFCLSDTRKGVQSDRKGQKRAITEVGTRPARSKYLFLFHFLCILLFKYNLTNIQIDFFAML